MKSENVGDGLVYAKGALFSFFFYLFLLLSPKVVYARPPYTGILDSEPLNSILNFVFVELKDPLGVKLLFGLFLFVVLFGASQMVMGRFAQNIRLFLSFILAIISIIFVPIEALMAIATAYGVFFSTAAVAIPAVGGAYFVFSVFDGEDTLSYSIKAIISIIMCWLLLSFGWGV